MKSISLNIEMENAAFDDGNDGLNEVARILESLALRLKDRSLGNDKLKDINGNTVGRYSLFLED